MTSIVDTHCHIDLGDYDADRDIVIKSALDAGVHALIAIGFNPERWRTCLALTQGYPFIVRAVGVHPNDAGIWNSGVSADLMAECRAEAVVAVGEIGLDYYRNRSTRECQLRSFSDQLTIARELCLPVIIHQRDAEHEILGVLDSFAPLNGVMHCFTGDESFGRECTARGLSLGIGGVATFPRSVELRKAIAALPLDRMIVETDAPFLAPQRQRGRRNVPANVLDVVESIAAVRETTVDEIASATTANAIGLFGPGLASALEHGRSSA